MGKRKNEEETKEISNRVSSSGCIKYKVSDTNRMTRQSVWSSGHSEGRGDFFQNPHMCAKISIPGQRVGYATTTVGVQWVDIPMKMVGDKQVISLYGARWGKESVFGSKAGKGRERDGRRWRKRQHNKKVRTSSEPTHTDTHIQTYSVCKHTYTPASLECMFTERPN